ncbi:MAG: hypothetical protein HRU15_01105, partial [Planctomycetes bacterium]|nr:hypothetical protein [Planctomycetota bacterium]
MLFFLRFRTAGNNPDVFERSLPLPAVFMRADVFCVPRVALVEDEVEPEVEPESDVDTV